VASTGKVTGASAEKMVLRRSRLRVPRHRAGVRGLSTSVSPQRGPPMTMAVARTMAMMCSQRMLSKRSMPIAACSGRLSDLDGGTGRAGWRIGSMPIA
jgi:hypothetical protein